MATRGGAGAGEGAPQAGTDDPPPPAPLRLVRQREPADGVTHDFTAFYAANFDRLVVQLYVYAGDISHAQDAVQEAFARALPRWKKLSTYDDPAAWVRRVAWNLATSRWRQVVRLRLFASRQREEHHPGPDPDRVVLWNALATLPDKLRRALILHYLAGLTVAEIARQEDVADGTVKSWLHRGRAALAAVLSETDREPDDA